MFYVFPIFWIATHLDGLLPLLDPPSPDYLWPVRWIGPLGPPGAQAVLALGIAAFVLGAWRPDVRWIRVGVFLGLLEILALQYSFGKIHHLMHGWLYTSFIFAVFLPNEALESTRATRRETQHTLLVVHASQVMLCLTYSLAGIGKLLGTIYQGALGQITPLHPSALARHVADRLLQTYPESLLGPWMIQHGAWLWPAMLGTLYLQLFAVLAAFRPRLHRLWGLGLIAFHGVTALSMTIDFSPNIMLLALLMVASPLSPRSSRLETVAQDLPILGAVFSLGMRAWRTRSVT